MYNYDQKLQEYHADKQHNFVVRVEKIDFREATQSLTNDRLCNNAEKLVLWKLIHNA